MSSFTTYHQQQASNKRRSLVLLGTMSGLLGTLVFVFALYFGFPVEMAAILAVVVVVFTSVSAWYQSSRLVIMMTGAREVDMLENRRLHNLVEEMALAADIPKPAVYIVHDSAPNAFATGRDPEHGAVAFTTGLLALMDRAELEGVVAHELAHIKNRDTLVAAVSTATAGALVIVSDLALRMTIFGGGRNRSNAGGNPIVLVIALLLAVLAPIAGIALQAAVSRSRESLADATAVEFTRNPAGLRCALEKLAHDTTVVRLKSRAAAHVWLESPLDDSVVNKMFSTHPPLAERIAVLAALEGYSESPSAPRRAPAPAPVPPAPQSTGFPVVGDAAPLGNPALGAAATFGIMGATSQKWLPPNTTPVTPAPPLPNPASVEKQPDTN